MLYTHTQAPAKYCDDDEHLRNAPEPSTVQFFSDALNLFFGTKNTQTCCHAGERGQDLPQNTPGFCPHSLSPALSSGAPFCWECDIRPFDARTTPNVARFGRTESFKSRYVR